MRYQPESLVLPGKNQGTEKSVDCATGKVEVDELRPDGSRWKTTVPIAGFGKESNKLVSLQAGDLLLLKGRVGWTAADGLCITVRSVERLLFDDDEGQDDGEA